MLKEPCTSYESSFSICNQENGSNEISLIKKYYSDKENISSGETLTKLIHNNKQKYCTSRRAIEKNNLILDNLDSQVLGDKSNNSINTTQIKKFSPSNSILSPLHANISSKELKCDFKVIIKPKELQKNISSQEKLLKNLQKKILSEKAEIGIMAAQFLNKENDGVDMKRSRENSKHIAKASITSLNKPSLSRKHSCKEDQFYATDSSSMKKLSNYGFHSLVNSPVNYLNDELDEKRFNIASSISSSKRNEEKNIDLVETAKIKELRGSFESLALRHEKQLRYLKNEITQIKKENYLLKQGNVLNPIEILNNSEKLGASKENHYAKIIIELQNALYNKDLENTAKEKEYKEKINNLENIIYTIKSENNRIPELENCIHELTNKLYQQVEEVKVTKKINAEKSHKKGDDQIFQKKEWSHIYTELLKEIRQLKNEINELKYENICLTKTLESYKMIEQSDCSI